ncbi:DUF3037 domain-containing protein [Leeuwenhoekiella sp. MAR_2009_132]|uniref:DUF3037 domain-containing protein n=1 Tax=Leeuwenhoekiella sp. MAR_2009_132 TaxID=1392489 RepID=UPI00048B9F5C|nr:DUF3037 domain-containing protein [Leeuwenhoekiella sp. MAR_2009_132]
MHEKHLYEYAVIRLVPAVDREEFFNVGVIVYCKNPKYINMNYQLDAQKLVAFCPELDAEQVQKNLNAFKAISCGEKTGGPIAQLEASERFRWLTATRSSVIQTSKTHPGFSDDLEATLEQLFVDLVL